MSCLLNNPILAAKAQVMCVPKIHHQSHVVVPGHSLVQGFFCMATPAQS
jgi:hypothetical protein